MFSLLFYSCFLSHLIFSTGPGPCSSGTSDLGLQGEQGVKQHPGLSDLASNVGVKVLAEHLRVLCGRQHGDVLLVRGLGAVPRDVVGGQGRQPDR